MFTNFYSKREILSFSTWKYIKLAAAGHSKFSIDRQIPIFNPSGSYLNNARSRAGTNQA
jgi:hypothetical protein